MIGQTLAHYRITAAIGSGGMGEVYRATDTSLGREVAIKMLATELARDPERLARFRREAHLLASLNHPNIAAIFGLDEAGGTPFLALELVEGEDFKDRIARGPVPLGEALPIARQVAEALEEAHEKGIVHRDPKPANVKLTPDGRVKVLDFGLAKAYGGDASAGSAPNLSQSPTLAHTGTQAGVILGTAAYMSPEQACGRAVDKRADIWAFGVVLWEMLTGRALFAGILAREPDWRQLAREAQRAQTLLARCLEKDPRKRFRDIGDVRLEIERLQAGAPATTAAPAHHQAARRLGLVLGLVAAAAVGGVLTRVLVPAAPKAMGPLRLSIALPASQQLSQADGSLMIFTTPDRAHGELGHWWPQILPGGRAVIFTAFRTPLDTSKVEVVSLDTGRVRELVDGGFFGRYVPSGHLLYVRAGRLFAVRFDPRQAAVVGPAKSVLDDVFASQMSGFSLIDVSAEGTLAYVPASLADPPRELVQVTRDGRSRPAIPDLRRYIGVSVSPDGRFLATSIMGESRDVWTWSRERQILSRLTTGPRTEFDPFWSRDGGTVFFVLDRPPFEIDRIAFGTSAEGEPLWKERAELDTLMTGLSSDGRFVVYELTEPGTGDNLWVRPVDGSTPARSFRATPYAEAYGTFSPDGRWMAYQSDETGRPEVYVEAFPGPGERRQISADGGTEPLWVRGTGEIFYRHSDEMRVVAVRTSPRLQLGTTRTLFTLSWAATDNDARSYDVSPDGQLVFMVRIHDANAPRRIDLVTHWLDELAREVPR